MDRNSSIEDYFSQFSGYEENEDEIWKPIAEFPDHYEVSNMGHVRRKSNKRVLKPTHHPRGPMVHLYIESVCHQRLISALMKRNFPK